MKLVLISGRLLVCIVRDVRLPDYCDLLKSYAYRNNRFILHVFLLVAKTNLKKKKMSLKKKNKLSRAPAARDFGILILTLIALVVWPWASY